MASTKLVCKKRKISGYNIYHREILKSSDPSVYLGDLNKMIGEQWQALTQQEREEFNQIASVEPTRVATLKDFLNHLAKLSNAIKDTFGTEMLFTLVKDNEHYCGGTAKGISFLEDQAPYIPYSFIGYLHHPVATSGAQILADTDINVKRKQVEEVFNKLYGEANRDGSKKLPYSKISSLGITVTGLPDGVSLKHPSSYGRKQLQSILHCKERLIINFCSPVHGDRQSSRVNTTAVSGAVGNRTEDDQPRVNTTVGGAVGNRTEDDQPRVNTTVSGAVGNRTENDQPRVNTTVSGAVGNRTGDGRPRMNTTVSGAVGNRTENDQPRVNTTVSGAVGNRTEDGRPRVNTTVGGAVGNRTGDGTA